MRSKWARQKMPCDVGGVGAGRRSYIGVRASMACERACVRVRHWEKSLGACREKYLARDIVKTASDQNANFSFFFSPILCPFQLQTALTTISFPNPMAAKVASSNPATCMLMLALPRPNRRSHSQGEWRTPRALKRTSQGLGALQQPSARKGFLSIFFASIIGETARKAWAGGAATGGGRRKQDCPGPSARG